MMPAPMKLQAVQHHRNENLFTHLGGVIDPIPHPNLKENAQAGTSLIDTASINNFILTEETALNYNEDIKIGEVRESIISILPHHNQRVPGNRRLRQSVAAMLAIKEYLTIAEYTTPQSILDDARFCKGKGSANPKKHQTEFKNSMVAKLLWDAWFGADATVNYKCINSFNHYPVHKNFFRPLAEWFVLYMNPHGDLKIDSILGTDPAEALVTYKRKGRNFGVYDANVVVNYDDMQLNAPNTKEHTKLICRGLPLPFAMFLDRNYDNFWEDCKFTETHLMYLKDEHKVYDFWKKNRKNSTFQRVSGINIPTAVLPPLVPAPSVVRENELAKQIIELRKQVKTLTQQRNSAREGAANKHRAEPDNAEPPNETLKRKADVLEKDLMAEKEKRVKYENLYKKYYKELVDSNVGHLKQSIKNLKEKAVEDKDTIDAMKNDIQKLKEKLASDKVKIEILKEDKKLLNETNVDLRTTIQYLQKDQKAKDVTQSSDDDASGNSGNSQTASK